MKETGQGAFEVHRSLLEGLAYRMCGVRADAQDIVQETHIRWNAAHPAHIANPRAWLVTVCTRLAMDHLKSARVRREQYVGVWLPEPFLESPAPSPAAQSRIDDSVSMALMLALERLTPAERAAFLLHDVFGYDFDEIADIIGKSPESCRKSASRARKAVRENRPRFAASPETHRRLLDAFLGAVRQGDTETLKSVLTESIAFHSDGGGLVNTAPGVLHGPDAVITFFLDVWRENIRPSDRLRMDHCWFNGQPGALIYRNDQLEVALTLSVDDNQISRLFALRNPEKLAAFQPS
jgi:RNA polymerase sigma-70 factor (ECF subfamily)